MLETVNDFGRKVTAFFKPREYCTFAPPEETLGFIDTSGERDGSRGIAFLCDEIRTNFDGIISRAGYKKITSVTILKSYETTFDDELEIDMPGTCIRISDCSLNKFFLKQLINNLCRLYYTMPEARLAELHEHCTARAMEHFSGNIPQITVAVPTPEEEAIADTPAEAEPTEIPDGKIVWISGKKPVKEELPEEDITPEDMSHDEVIDYLKNSINEINSTDGEDRENELSVDEELDALEESWIKQAKENSPLKSFVPGLTEEPESDDIYIKASRRIRIYCADGSLTMAEIEAEVKEKMVSAAEIYTKISTENEIPPVLSNRISALKTASDNLTQYFELGEDIAARVMFFMLYQMLSYADRIAEQEETKERLNDFFKRFGSAGMALSLLDSGI